MAKRDEFSSDVNSGESGGSSGAGFSVIQTPTASTDLATGNSSIRIAQSTNGQQQDTSQPVDLSSATVIATFTSTAFGTRIELPPGTKIDRVFIKEGDLYILQDDNKVIVIEGGGTNYPTLVLAPQIEISAEKLQAALENAQEGVPTAGPETGPDNNQSSGNSFPKDPGGIGEIVDLTPLLPPTALAFELFSNEDFNADLLLDGTGAGTFTFTGDSRRVQEDDLSRPFQIPTANSIAAFGVSTSESWETSCEVYYIPGQTDGNNENETVPDQWMATGSLGIDAGLVSLIDGTPTFSPGLTEPAGLTSNGVPIKYSVNLDNNFLTASAGERTIFTVELKSDGTYKVILFHNLDHLLPGEEEGERVPQFEQMNTTPHDLGSLIGLELSEEDINVLFLFDVSFTDGGSGSGQFDVNFQDDFPLIVHDNSYNDYVDDHGHVPGYVNEKGLIWLDKEYGENQEDWSESSDDYGNDYLTTKGYLDVYFGADDGEGDEELGFEGRSIKFEGVSDGDQVFYLKDSSGDLQIPGKELLSLTRQVFYDINDEQTYIEGLSAAVGYGDKQLTEDDLLIEVFEGNENASITVNGQEVTLLGLVSELSTENVTIGDLIDKLNELGMNNTEGPDFEVDLQNGVFFIANANEDYEENLVISGNISDLGFPGLDEDPEESYTYYTRKVFSVELFDAPREIGDSDILSVDPVPSNDGSTFVFGKYIFKLWDQVDHEFKTDPSAEPNGVAKENYDSYDDYESEDGYPTDFSQAFKDFLALNFQFKATDSDGDWVIDFFDVVIKDSIPKKLSIEFGDEFELIHDETAGVQPSPDDPLNDEISESSSGMENDTGEQFPVSLGFLTDAAGIGQAMEELDIDVVKVKFGADKPGQVSFMLQPSEKGVFSGLQATQPAPGGNPDAPGIVDDKAFTPYPDPKIYLYTVETPDGETLVVGRVGNGTDDGGKPNGLIAFVLYVTPDGEEMWSKQFLAIDHDFPEDDGNEFDSVVFLDEGTLLLTAMAVDFDNDMIFKSLDIGEYVGFEDDGPRIISERAITATVDEDDLDAAKVDNEDPPVLSQGTEPNDGAAGDQSLTNADGSATHSATIDLSNLIDVGNDGGYFMLQDGELPDGLESKGENVDYEINDNGTLLTATADGRTVFTVSLNPITGILVFTLFDQLDHDPPPNGTLANQNTIEFDLSGFIKVTDGDTDFLELDDGLVLLNVTDDIPKLIVQDGFIANSPGMFVGDLVDIGADEDGFLEFTDNKNTIENYLEGIFGDDIKVSLTDGNTRIDVDIDQPRGAPDIDFFEVILNNDGTYKFILQNERPSEQIEIDITGNAIDSGNFPNQVVVGVDLDNSPPDEFYTEISAVQGTDIGGSVNVSNQGFGVDDQFLDTSQTNPDNLDERLKFRFYSDTDPSTSPSEDEADGTLGQITFDQEQTSITFKGDIKVGGVILVVTALMITHDGTTITDTPVGTPVIYDFSNDGNTDQTFTFDAASAGVADFDGLIINAYAPSVNVPVGDGGTWDGTVATLTDFDGNANEQIRLFEASIGGGETIPEDETLTFNFAAQDFDEDVVEGSFDVTLLGGIENSATLVTGDDDPNVLLGSPELDVLTGNGGNDTFVLDDLSFADIIADYLFGENDDIDLTQLFTADLDSANPDINSLSQFVKIEVMGADAELQVDTDGGAGGSGFVAAATLTGLGTVGSQVNITFNNDGETTTETLSVV